MEEARRRARYAIRAPIDRIDLTADRERQLLRTAQTSSDDVARQAAWTELWETHSKLVVATVSRYRYLVADLLDLAGAGHLGLHVAISRFDPDRFESRLSTYALGWIRWHIQDHIRRNSAPPYRRQSAAHRQLMHMSGRLFGDTRGSCHRDGVGSTEAELSARIGRRIGMPAAEVVRGMHLIQGGTLNPQPGTIDDPRVGLPDGTVSPEDATVLRLDSAKSQKRLMALTQEILGERERTVFLVRCMTDSDEVGNIDSLANDIGASRERVYEFEFSARQKIATAMAREGYDDFAPDGDTFRPPPGRPRRRRIVALPLRKELPRARSAG